MGVDVISRKNRAFLLFSPLPAFLVVSVFAVLGAQEGRAQSAMGLRAMGLRAMGIADQIVNLAFGLVLGAVAVAFAIAFGMGGRDSANRLMRHWVDRYLERKSEDKS